MKKMDTKKLSKIYSAYLTKAREFQKMIRYYKGDTDAKRNYLMTTERSNLTIGVNYIKKFVDEEVSYTLGNDIVYESRTNNQKLIDDINYHLSSLRAAHDANLLEMMLITSIAYELYYVDHDGNFNAKVIPPTEGFAVLDEFGRVELFLHIFEKPFDDREYIDVYTDSEIIHYDSKWNEIAPRNRHIFGDVPVGIATWDRERDQTHKTIYATSKGLQDGYETSLSDRVNEIADFRNAQMVMTGVDIDEEDMVKFKKLGMIQIPNSDGKVQWISKDLTGAEGLMTSNQEILSRELYEQNGHLSPAEKISRGAESFLAIQAKHTKLLDKAKSNQKALEDAIKSRIRFLIIYMRTHDEKANEYDYRDVFPIFTANLPTDDYSTAEMIEKLDGIVPRQTLISRLSFVKDPAAELEKLQKEREELLGMIEYDDLGD